MEDQIKKGIIKFKITEFDIRSLEISDIIKQILVEKGYDLELEAIVDGNNYLIGEKFKVFKTQSK